MEYSEYKKPEQAEWLKAQIRDLETQHFQQEQFAAMAAAAAEVPEPDEGDQSVAAQTARTMRTSYADQAAQHRLSMLESANRIAAARAALALIEGPAESQEPVKE